MGMTPNEKANFAAYQLKDVAQILYTQSRDTKVQIGGKVTWEIFKSDFLDNMEDFINLHQGGFSFLDYSLKFTKFSK